MGYLLKEALKTLCGVNPWSYAVFWKFGCQNPRLLIWEECYYEPLTCSVPPRGHDTCDSPFGAVPPESLSCQPVIQAEDKLQSLINRMMMNNQICLIGEGIIGRAAFTGNYQWFLSNNFGRDVHPPEVSNEMHHQFSAGIQTFTVIPVLPHGVIQLGSSFSIMENLGFVNGIKSLILQLGCIPGALFSMGSAENVRVSGHLGMGLTDTPDDGKMTSSNNSRVDRSKKLRTSSDCSRLISGRSSSLVRKIQENSSSTDYSFQSCFRPLEKVGFCPRSQVERGVVRTEVIRPNPDEQLNQSIASYTAYSGVSFQTVHDQMGVRHSIKPIEKQVPLAPTVQSLVNSETSDLHSTITSQSRMHRSSVLDSSKSFDAARFLEGGELLNEFKNHPRPVPPPSSFGAATEPSVSNQTELEGIPLFSLSEQLMAYTSEVLSGGSDQINHPLDMNHPRLDSPRKNRRTGNDSTLAPNLPLTYLNEDKPLLDSGRQGTVFPDLSCEDLFQQSEGDGLFDIFGVEMKNKILNGRFDSAASQKFSTEGLISIGTQVADENLNLVDEGVSEGGIFSMARNDNLLDAVVSGAHSASKQNSSDDSLSCKTTLTGVSSCSVPSNSLAYCQSNTTDNVHVDYCHVDSFGTLRPRAKEGTLGLGSLVLGCTKNNGAACSQSNSLCSQIRSWVGQGHNRDNNTLTALSEGPDEVKKLSRKRLKPGENPKPRPKDRQMIQDRLKELRDMVPNGAKCSIDALLERTVKHMLFLQGVTKHADRRKHIGESRIIDKEGSVFLKDNFEGGATWAFDTWSQSGVCPIIVEDLNLPRQLLVEMLCEERGFFLEIADMIRRLGLTILTGMMESRNEKIWARFAVEANRDVTRMQVFMSLVRALEQLTKGVSMPETATGPFARATSISATGMPSSNAVA